MMHETPSMPHDYEAKYDLETIERANEIKADASRMSRVKAYAKEQAAKMAKIAGYPHSTEAAMESMMQEGHRKLK